MLSSPGIGSGLDVSGIISQLMQLEQRPLTQLNTKEAKQQAQLSAFGSLKSALSTFQDSVRALAKPSLFNGFKATLADTTAATVSTSSSAAAGTHQIEVQSLAQAQKIKSEAFATTDTVIGSGSLTIEFGTYSEEGTFTANAEKMAKTITIDPAKSTLADIRNAINEANAGVTASIVNDGSGNRLVISSKDSGLANALKISVNDNDGDHTDNAGLSKLTFDASTGSISNMVETVAAQNAVMVIDGITVAKSSNIISDALEGVTFNLLKANPGTSTTLTVEKNTGSVEAAVKALVTSYNELEKTIGNLSRYDAASKQAAVLTGDSTVRMIQSRVRAMLNGNQSAAGGISSLSELGISFQKDSTLALDNSKLSAALNDPDKNIAAFFTTQEGEAGDGIAPVEGFASRLSELIDGMTRSDGLINSRMDGINSTIRGIGKQRDALGHRLEEVEKRLRAQFTALDTMIASMTQTSNYLQQQLANLPKIGD